MPKNSVAQLDNQTRDLQTAIASDKPKEQIENTPLKEEADRLKDFSQSPLITIDDEIKPEPGRQFRMTFRPGNTRKARLNLCKTVLCVKSSAI